MNTISALRILPDPEKLDDFATPNRKAKPAGVDIDDVAKQIHSIVKKEHLDYEQLPYLFRKVRSLAGIRKEKKPSGFKSHPRNQTSLWFGPISWRIPRVDFMSV